MLENLMWSSNAYGMQWFPVLKEIEFCCKYWNKYVSRLRIVLHIAMCLKAAMIGA